MTSKMQRTRWFSLVLPLAAAVAFAPGAANGQDVSISRALRNATGLVLPAVTVGERSPALAPALLARGAALAQDASIEGVVVDATDLVLPGVTVDARNQAIGAGAARAGRRSCPGRLH